MSEILIQSLKHASPAFDAAYEVISANIGPDYLETRDFLRKRLAVRDSGPKTAEEKILVQHGYTLHLLATFSENRAAGAIYGHLISGITGENRSVCFVTYVAVEGPHRRQGIGTNLVRALQKAVDDDAVRLTGKHIFGTVYEIEKDGKKEIKNVVKKLGAGPLDIVYYQPALRSGHEPQRMDLWFQPVPALSREEAAGFSLGTEVARSLVHNMMAMEYVGPELKGFDFESEPYRAFLDSIEGEKTIGFIKR